MIRKLHNHIPTHCTHMTLWQWQPIIISGRTKNCQILLHHTWPKTNKENLNLKNYFLIKISHHICLFISRYKIYCTFISKLCLHLSYFNQRTTPQMLKVFKVSGHVTLILFTSILYLYMQTSTYIMKLYQCLNLTQCDKWTWKNQGRL